MADNSSGVKSELPKVDATVDVELDEDISANFNNFNKFQLGVCLDTHVFVLNVSGI